MSLLTYVIINLILFDKNCFFPGEGIRCSMCDTTGENPIACLTHPPAAQECGEGHDYCINVAKYTDAGLLIDY